MNISELMTLDKIQKERETYIRLLMFENKISREEAIKKANKDFSDYLLKIFLERQSN